MGHMLCLTLITSLENSRITTLFPQIPTSLSSSLHLQALHLLIPASSLHLLPQPVSIQTLLISSCSCASASLCSCIPRWLKLTSVCTGLAQSHGRQKTHSAERWTSTHPQIWKKKEGEGDSHTLNWHTHMALLNYNATVLLSAMHWKYIMEEGKEERIDRIWKLA